MVIPLAIFYYIYLGIVAVFLFLSFVALYHLLRFSHFSIVSNIVSLAYIMVTLAIFLISWHYIGQVNWQEAIPITSTFEQGLSL